MARETRSAAHAVMTPLQHRAAGTQAYAVEREVAEAERLFDAFNRLHRLAREVPEPQASQINEEAWRLVRETPPARVKTAEALLGISNAAVRDWVAAGVLEAAGMRPLRVTFDSVVRARLVADELRAQGTQRLLDRVIERLGGARLDAPLSPALQSAASGLTIHEGMLRRWLTSGTLRPAPGVSQLDVDDIELRYLIHHGRLLAALSTTLDAEPGVALAVLYGSTARGDDHPDSDIDILIQSREPQPDLIHLAGLLREHTGRPVQFVDTRSAAVSPALLSNMFLDGRVLRDDEKQWARWRAERDHVDELADKQTRQLLDREREAIASLLGESG